MADKDADTNANEPELDAGINDALESVSEGVEGELQANADPFGEVEESEEEEGAGETGSDDGGDTGDASGESEDDGEQEDESKDSDDSDDSTTTDGSDNGSTEDADSKQQPVVPAPKAEPAAQLEDPGDFEPGDYAFEVTTTDGKVHKISTPEDAETFAALLDDDPELIGASQFLQFNRKASAMDGGLEADQRTYQAKKEAYEAQTTAQAEADNQLNQWASEVKYLRSIGELPEITPELDKANWNDPANAKQPPIAETMKIFTWMEKENVKREAAGLPRMTSALEARGAMQLEQLKTQKVDTKKTDLNKRQAKGAAVRASSSQAPTQTKAGTIVGEGGSLDDMLTDYYNED